MNEADWAITAVLVISCLISLKRGFVKEALSLGAWVLAFFVATAFNERLTVILASVIENPSLRHITAYATLFIGTLMVVSLLNKLLAQVIKMTGLSGLDRLMGTVFGLVRGLVVVLVIIVILRQLAPIEQESLWQTSSLLPHLLLLENWSREVFSQLFDGGIPQWT